MLRAERPPGHAPAELGAFPGIVCAFTMNRMLEVSSVSQKTRPALLDTETLSYWLQERQ